MRLRLGVEMGYRGMDLAQRRDVVIWQGKAVRERTREVCVGMGV